MNKTLIAVLAAIVVIGGGAWFGYSQWWNPFVKSGNSSEWMLSASFMCDDNTHFIAEFPTAEELRVVVDGRTVRTLPHVAGDGQRFEDTSYAYVFAGEEASVTDKAANKTATCTQPNDPNNAPVNFGDAGEGGGVKQDASLIVSESILGKWQSTDDPKFVREFQTDGKIVDRYDNETKTSGLWVAFTKANAPKVVPFPLDETSVYIQVTETGSQSDTLNFKLSKLTPDELELVYMDRGGVLKFTHVAQ